jgi:hypothetical protein
MLINKKMKEEERIGNPIQNLLLTKKLKISLGKFIIL